MERPSDRIKKEIFQLLDALADSSRTTVTPSAVDVSAQSAPPLPNTGGAQPTRTNNIFKINKIVFHGNIEIR